MQKTLKRQHGYKSDQIAYRLLIWPSFIVLFSLTVIPLLFNFYLAFTNTTITTLNAGKFIGLNNFVTIFTRDRFFWDVSLTTLKLVVGTVSLQVVFGMLVALLWNVDFRGVRICRLLHLVPMMITGIVAGYIWRILLNTDMGLINYFLSLLGIDRVNWLGDETNAVFSVLLVNLWSGTPFVTIILLSALQGVDSSYIEAAIIDGANRVQIFFRVVLPVIRSSVLMAIMMRTMDAIRQYDLIDVLTHGGPGIATQQLNLYTYEVGFTQWRMGYGAALSTIILLIILCCSMVFMHFINKSNQE